MTDIIRDRLTIIPQRKYSPNCAKSWRAEWLFCAAADVAPDYAQRQGSDAKAAVISRQTNIVPDTRPQFCSLLFVSEVTFVIKLSSEVRC